MRRRALADRWRDGDRLDGILTPMPAPVIVEIAGRAGFDFVVFDTEHGPSDDIALHGHIAIAKAHGMGALVRTHPDARPALARALDLGADGVMVADVRSGHDASAAVDIARFAPHGSRGFATGTTAAGWGLGDAEEHARQRPLVVAMIEHPDAVAAVAEITSVAGVDGVFVGRMDLAMARSLGPRPAHLDVLGDVERVRVSSATRLVELAEDAAAGAVRLHNAPRLISRALSHAHDEAHASDRSTR